MEKVMQELLDSIEENNGKLLRCTEIRDIHDIRSHKMEKVMQELLDSIEEMKTNNGKLLRCTEILTNIIDRGKHGGSDELFCVTHLTKQEVLELTQLDEDDQ